MSFDNTYTELAIYYDNLMTSGYYDHDGYATSLHEIVDKRRTILDMGIGTGLFTERLLSLADYQITGIDYSLAMLEQARTRLKDTSVDLICEDIEKYETNDTFEAIISIGGTLSLSYREQEQQYRLYSYCCDKISHRRLLKKLYRWLKTEGVLCISIQGEHTDCEMPIKDGIVYSQHVESTENVGKKTYTFSLNDKILVQQTLQAIFFDEQESLSLFSEAGFSFIGPDRTKKFGIFKKKELCD